MIYFLILGLVSTIVNYFVANAFNQSLFRGLCAYFIKKHDIPNAQLKTIPEDKTIFFWGFIFRTQYYISYRTAKFAKLYQIFFFVITWGTIYYCFILIYAAILLNHTFSGTLSLENLSLGLPAIFVYNIGMVACYVAARRLVFAPVNPSDMRK